MMLFDQLFYARRDARPAKAHHEDGPYVAESHDYSISLNVLYVFLENVKETELICQA